MTLVLIEQGVGLALSVSLGVGGVVNVIGPAPLRKDYVRWSYPSWFGSVTGALLILAAILVAVPALRVIGLALAILVTLAAIGTLLRARGFGHSPPGIVLLTVLLLVMWVTI